MISQSLFRSAAPVAIVQLTDTVPTMEVLPDLGPLGRKSLDLRIGPYHPHPSVFKD